MQKTLFIFKTSFGCVFPPPPDLFDETIYLNICIPKLLILYCRKTLCVSVLILKPYEINIYTIQANFSVCKRFSISNNHLDIFTK